MIPTSPLRSTNNLIQSGRRVAGLDTTGGSADWSFATTALPTGPLPIVVEQHLVLDATGTLRLEFDADPWDSTISFAPGIPVALGGTLELAFALGVNAGAQSGRTFDLFDWTGVSPTGSFNVSSPFTWNLTNLYTTGEVTLLGLGTGIAGDFNGDGSVNGADLSEWQGGFDTTIAATHAQGDADGDHDVDGGDFWSGSGRWVAACQR